MQCYLVLYLHQLMTRLSQPLQEIIIPIFIVQIEVPDLSQMLDYYPPRFLCNSVCVIYNARSVVKH